MKISLVRKSDYLALFSGNANRLRLGFSEDPRAVLASLSRTEGAAPRNVLLLGATGFIGMHLLQELLQHPRIARVYTLVRKKGSAPGLQRISLRMRQFGMTLEHPEKLEVLEGSFTEPRFGLAPSEYDGLGAQVDLVINAAGSTNHTYGYSYYRKETLLSLLRLMEFCVHQRLKALHYIGSVGCEVYRQRKDFFRLGFFHCGYSRMKWVAKHLVQLASRHGLPAHVYLPSFVLGSHATAFKDPGMSYSFWQMLWYASELGMMWDCGDALIPIVPGDMLARSVLDNAFHDSPRNVVYPALQVSSRELAERFGWTHVPWEEFRKAMRRRFSFRLRRLQWRRPLRSTLELARHVLFTRSLFPRYLPQVLGNISAASAPAPTPAAPRPPNDKVPNSARPHNIHRRGPPYPRCRWCPPP